MLLVENSSTFFTAHSVYAERFNVTHAQKLTQLTTQHLTKIK